MVSDVDGIATLDKTRVDSEANWDKIVEACETKEILEGKIVEVVKGGVIISINSVRVFIPASLTGVPKDGDLYSLVNTIQKVKIVEIKADRKRAYASIRAVLRDERKAKEDAFWAEIAEGKEYDGEIKSLTDFGAFVELESGVDALLHVSQISTEHVEKPADVLKVGDSVTAKVVDFNEADKKISLSIKALIEPEVVEEVVEEDVDVADVDIEKVAAELENEEA